MLKVTMNKKEKEFRDVEHFFFYCLTNKYVNFFDLLSMYVSDLEESKQKHLKQLAEADMPLIEFIIDGKPPKKRPETIDVGIRYLLKYGRFKNAPIQKTLEKIAKENNINIEGDYYMNLYNKVDEFGKIEAKKVSPTSNKYWEN